jgi:preprotein translocase subunit SecD
VPNFSPPPPAQRVANTNPKVPSSSNEPRPTLRSFDAERKRQERAKENEQQRNQRLINDRLRKVSARQHEDESQRNIRLAYKRQHAEKSRRNEDENQRSNRLNGDQLRAEVARAAESAEKTHERIRSISVRRRQRSLENKNRAKSDSLHWPRAIPTQQKGECLQDFVNQTSMSMLKQAVCSACNLRAFVSSMDEYDVSQIPNQARLACHPDLLAIIPGTESIPPGSPRYLLEFKRDFLSSKIRPQIQPATAYPI